MWLITENNTWRWGDSKIIFTWDILADRNADWFKILYEINRLRKEAKAKNGNISILVWNHDNFMNSYLLNNFIWPSDILDNLAIYGKSWCKILTDNNITDNSQGYWIIELFQFLDNKKTETKFTSLKWKHKEILENMRKSINWIIILEEICNMKIIDQIDDTQVFHTPKNISMSKMLWTYGMDFINKIFQNTLKRQLIDNEDIHLSPLYQKIIFTFLHTNNRKINNVNYSRNWEQSLFKDIPKALEHIDWNNDKTVNLTVCWHDRNMGTYTRYKNKKKIVSIDTGYGVSDCFSNKRSILKIDKIDWKLTTIFSNKKLEINR